MCAFIVLTLFSIKSLCFLWLTSTYFVAFGASINGVLYSVIFAIGLVLVYENTIEFCILFLHLTGLLNSFNFSSLLVFLSFLFT